MDRRDARAQRSRPERAALGNALQLPRRSGRAARNAQHHARLRHAAPDALRGLAEHPHADAERLRQRRNLRSRARRARAVRATAPRREAAPAAAATRRARRARPRRSASPTAASRWPARRSAGTASTGTATADRLLRHGLLRGLRLRRLRRRRRRARVGVRLQRRGRERLEDARRGDQDSTFFYSDPATRALHGRRPPTRRERRRATTSSARPDQMRSTSGRASPCRRP
jgi:hypothetical protein